MSLNLSRVSGWSFRGIGKLALCGVLGSFFILDPTATQITASAQVTGLVAAYSFDEGAGATVADVSGNGNGGTISGATWTSLGKFGAALSFNGSNARVTIPDSSSLDLTNAMTLEAWVMPSVVPSTWSAVVDKDVDRYYLMAGTNNLNRPAVGGTFGTTNQNVFGTAPLPAGAWTHLAATYDRTTIRLYVNGVQVATGAQTAAVSTSNAVLTIGADFYGEYFAGLIDEVRIYNRALTATEIQSDMATSATPGPRLTITQPADGSAIASSTIDVAYTAWGDLTGVDHVHFQLDANPEVMDLTLDGVYQFTNVPAGSHTLVGHLVRADHSAIPNTTSSVAFTTTQPDVIPPTVSITAPTSGATTSGVITLAANASDDLQVVGVQFKLDGANVGAEKTSPPYSVPMNTTTYSNALHSLTAVARDLGGNATTSVAVSFTIANANPNDPSRIGQWSAAFSWPIVGVHEALLPTGKVLSWTDHTNATGVQLWDPSTNTFRSIPYTGANLFCAGHTFLSDGRLLVVGGHAGTYVGISNSTVFDPTSETWAPSGFMTYARWYPTATTLGDGRVMTFSGSINCPSCLIPNDPHDGLADFAEIYNPTTSSWSQLAGAPFRLPMYPHMFVLPDGRIFASSANEDPIASVVLDLGAQQWTQIGGVLDGGSAAMYAPGKILKSGSAWNVDYPIAASAATTYVIDMNAPAPAWRQTPSMAFARTEHTLTLLPDGTVLATGGSGDSNVFDLAPVVYEAESWSPATETWTTLARMSVPRHYHSTALLLPDARVLVVGSGTFGVDQLSAQIFSPPYLFNGARPVITAAPASANLGSTFAVQTADAARIGSATLISLGAVTHAFNESQRIVPLSIQSGSGSIDVTLPGNPNLAPPGYYMLFLLDTNGVPSVSTMLRVVPVQDFVPPSVSLTSPAAGASLTGTTAVIASASDNVAVAGVQFLLDGAPLGTEIPGAGPTFTFNWNTANAVNGAHTLSAQARDGAGNTALAASIGVTVANAPSTGLVAAWGFNEGTGTSLSDSSGNGRTGTITGATWTTGRYGQALSFDGNDLVNLGDLDVPGTFTVMAWMQTRSLYSGTCGSLVMKPFDYGFELCSGQLAAKVAAGASAWSAGVATTVTNADLNAWRHVALTYDGTTLRFYVGGNLISSAAGAHASNNAALIFGRWTPATEYWNGLIDEVRIYNRALTQTEIQTDLATPVGGTPPVNTPPTISPLSPQTINEDTSTVALAFTVGDGETAAGSLTVSAGTSNATLAPVSNIVLGGTGASRTVAVTPAANQSGTATITVTVSDGQATASTSFLLTVTAVNDLPTISSVSNQTTSAGVAVGPLAVTVGDVETAATSLTLSGGSSNLSLVPVANIAFGGSGTARTVTVTPAGGQTGSATITLTVGDGQANASTSFVLTVTATNTPPTISPLSPQTVNEDASTGALAFTVGDGETPAGSLTTSGGSSNTTLVPASNIVMGGTGANRTVTVTPAANQSGTATITVTVSDGQATASTSFLLTVTAVNDLPTISSVANQATTAGVAVGPLAVTVGDVETAAGSLTLSGGSSNLSLVPVANIAFGGSGANRTVTVTPAAGQTGTATITVTVSDGQANASTGFVLTVTAAPTGLVAAWGFNEGTGTTLTDSSGNGRTGTITGATWTTGRYGQALSFDGNDLVDLGDLDLPSAFTVMAWMQTRSLYSGTCGSLVMKATDYGFELCGGQLGAKVASVSSSWSAAVTQPLTSADLNAWRHVAMTYDGTTLRFYVGGSLIGSAVGAHASNNRALIFGRWTPASEFWNGLIDEVRIYNRALTQTEIQTDLATPVGGTPPVNTPPTISALAAQTIAEDGSTSALAFTVGDGETAAGSLTVSTGSSDATLVPAGNIVLGGTGANRTVTVSPAANQSGTATITVTVSDGQATASTSFLLTVTAVNDLPAISSLANQVTGIGVALGPLAVTVGDVETAAGSLTLSGGSSNTALVAVANIVFGGSGAARTVTVTPAAGQTGTATITMTVGDGQANTSTSFVLTVTAAPPGLIAAWGFNEGAGTTLADSSGNGRTGTITGATWTAGRYGQALSFDGNDFVSLGDLDVPGAFTVMAWMQTRSLYSGTCGSLVMKALDYGFELCSGQLAGKVGTGTSTWTAAVAQPLTSADLNTWKHVALTYDGTTLRFYVGGSLVNSAAGAHASNNTALIFGRWTPATEYWNGLIDEVRIYNRALTQTEIQTDLATAVGGP